MSDDYITVRVGRLPGAITEIALNGDRTVQAALEAAGLDATGYEVKVSGNGADLSQVLQDNDTVLLVKKIRGN